MTHPAPDKSKAFRAGVIVFALLAVFTAAEFGVSLAGQSAAWIFFAIALVKAFLVVRDYMHVGKLFSDEEEHA